MDLICSWPNANYDGRRQQTSGPGNPDSLDSRFEAAGWGHRGERGSVFGRNENKQPRDQRTTSTEDQASSGDSTRRRASRAKRPTCVPVRESARANPHHTANGPRGRGTANGQGSSQRAHRGARGEAGTRAVSWGGGARQHADKQRYAGRPQDQDCTVPQGAREPGHREVPKERRQDGRAHTCTRARQGGGEANQREGSIIGPGGGRGRCGGPWACSRGACWTRWPRG